MHFLFGSSLNTERTIHNAVDFFKLQVWKQQQSTKTNKTNCLNKRYYVIKVYNLSVKTWTIKEALHKNNKWILWLEKFLTL